MLYSRFRVWRALDVIICGVTDIGYAIRAKWLKVKDKKWKTKYQRNFDVQTRAFLSHISWGGSYTNFTWDWRARVVKPGLAIQFFTWGESQDKKMT